MRIVIDATSLLVRSAGVKNYLFHWIRHLQAASGPDEVALYPFLGQLPSLDHAGSLLDRESTWARLALVNLLNVRGNPALSWLHRGTDVFHASHHLANGPSSARMTATLYDMTCWLMPSMHTAANVAAARHHAERVLRKTAGCIAISEQTRRDAIEVLSFSEDHVQVIYPGVAEQFFAAGGDAAHVVGARYGLTRPYLLHVGTIEPRKNLDGLLDAFQMLPGALRHEVDLVIAGFFGWCSQATRARLQGGLSGVHYLGYVPECDLPGLTAGAIALAYPSYYEGFGFPVAQAMAAGTPVVTSSGSALAEITQGAALLVDPRRPEEISDALRRVLEDPSLREQLSALGRSRAQRYRWERCAVESMSFFRRLALRRAG